MNTKLKGLPVSAVPLRTLRIDINPLRDFRYVANATRYVPLALDILLAQRDICPRGLPAHPRLLGGVRNSECGVKKF